MFYLGAFTQARVHLEQAVALYDLQQHRALAYRFGEDLGVACLAHTALALWVLGYADQALHRIQEALALGQALLHPHSLALALLLATWFHQLRREGQTALERAEAEIELAQEHGFPHILSQCMVWRGWAMVRQGQKAAGIAQMRQSLAALRATGIELGQSYYPTLFAEAYGHGGQADEALAVLATALALVETTGGRWWEAELQRLKGELLLAPAGTGHQGEGTRAKVADAETCLRQALAVARRSRPGPWSCVRPSAWPGYGRARASALRPTRCWRRSTVGSPKALTPPTSRRPGRCWKVWRDNPGEHTSLPIHFA